MYPRLLSCLGAALAATLVLIPLAPASSAAVAPRLGTTSSFAVLAGTEVTNTGPSVVNGDLGVSPGTAVSGFPPGLLNGVLHSADAVALQAKDDLVNAYNNAAGEGPPVDQSNKDLGGQTLVPGVYGASGAMALTGTVTLNGQGNPDAVFVFQAGSTLITASSSSVSLIGGARACNVYWQVGSSATLGTSTRFVGNILALTSADLQTGATLEGRVLARNGAVTLDTNTITRPTCASTSASSTSPSPTATPAPSTSPVVKSSGGTKKSDGKKSDGKKKSGGTTSGGDTTSGGRSGDDAPDGTSGDRNTGGTPTDTTADGTTTDTTGLTTTSGDVVPRGRPDTGRQARSPAFGSRGPGAVYGTAGLLLLAAAAAAIAVGNRQSSRRSR